MQAAHERREQTIERLTKRNRLSDHQAADVRNGLMLAPDLASLAQADLVTEAVSENANSKLSVYKSLRDAGFSGILTTNTSSLTRATLLAAGSCDASNFALTHFFNPVLYTQMVEVVKGDMATSSGEAVFSFLTSLGREPVETRDISGFVSNGILMVYAVMALRLLERGARIEQVDQAAKELGLLPPFISFDSWKPSIVEDVTRVMFDLRGDAFLRSSKLLARLAQGNPTFYVDRKPNAEIYRLAGAPANGLDDVTVRSALKTSILVAAARVAELGESPLTADFIAVAGVKLPNPPLKEIDAMGAAPLLRELAEVNERLAGGGLSAPKLLAAMAEKRQTFYRDDEPNPWLRSQPGK
jgi:3-hydroxybutyryl-CoA dehydrogenase